MKKYVCTICGYIYDEAKEKLKWNELPDDWTCPICGAVKSDFKELTEENKKVSKPEKKINHDVKEEMRELSNGELSALCSNLAKGCEKQYLAEEAGLFNQLADYYKDQVDYIDDYSFKELLRKINDDLEKGFIEAFDVANSEADRGTKRALTWSEKVTKILNSLILRYNKEGIQILAKTNIYVCEICGFIFIGDNPPAICPICKVPNLKILKVERS